MSGRRLALASLVTVLLAACTGSGGGGDPTSPGRGGPGSGARTYTVLVDGPSAAEQPPGGLVYSQFFPAQVHAAAGDTIRFRYEGTVGAHTATMGVEPDLSNAPSYAWEDGASTGVIEDPCTAPEPFEDIQECPNPPEGLLGRNLPAYDGTGYWNSGWIGDEQDLRLSPDIPAGDYPLTCLLHPGMTSVITVEADAADRDDPAEVERDGRAQQAAALEVTRIDEPDLAPAEVAAGWQVPGVQAFGFSPAEVTVSAGQAVTWLGADYVHSVAFGASNDGELPDGVPSGGDFDGTRSAYSGVLGHDFAREFVLRITRPGTYRYRCTFHASMEGTVVVEPT